MTRSLNTSAFGVSRPTKRVSLGRTSALVALLMALGLAACDPEPSPVQLEVYNWWTAVPEQEALERVIADHESAHPGVKVKSRDDETSLDQRDRLQTLMLAGAPPSTFQANIGAGLLKWTVVDFEGEGHASQNYLEDLSELFVQQRLYDTLDAALLEPLTVGGAGIPYAVPINIHRNNLLYYNQAALDAFQTSYPGRSFLELATLCPSDAARPELEFQIAVGVQDQFPLVILALENVLPALAGAELYRSVMEGRAEGAWTEQVRRALRCVQQLVPHFYDGGAAFGWVSAVEAVKRGAAAFTVMGDWANGLLQQELENGEVVAVPFPETEGLFVFTSDSFPLPVGAAHRAEVLDLLATIASAETQYAFSVEKGSIPARSDADGTNESYAARRAEFVALEKLLATSGYFPPFYQRESLEDALSRMVARGAGADEVEDVVAELVDLQPLFSLWQRRLQQGAAANAR